MPPSGTEVTTERRAPGTDARLLGQLLASQSVLPVLPTPQHVADFYARALSAIPGVDACHVCLPECSSAVGASSSEACAGCEATCAACEASRAAPAPAASGDAPAAPADAPSDDADAPREFPCAVSERPGVVALALATERRRFGHVVFRVSDAERFEPYRPFLANLANSLALSLENRRQRASLVAARDALERRVEERTLALSAANRKLADEVEERRRAEAAVRRLNDELRRALAESEDLYQNAPCGYHSLAPDGTYLRVNDTELRWIGLGREEVVGKLGLGDVLAPECREAFPADLAAALRDGAAQLEYEVVRQDGSRIPVLVSCVAVRDARGRIVHTRGTMYDLTEHRRAERALRDGEERFRQSQKLEAIGRLAGGVAHDFNNLLTVVLSCAGELLELLPPGTPGREEAQEIGDAGRRASHLTRQLLAFSRRQASAPVSLDLGEVVAGMESLLRRLIGEDVALEVVRAPGCGRVRADPGQLEQVILNLAVNARDAMPAGGRLRVEVSDVDVAGAGAPGLGVVPGRWVALAVRDTGSGMSPETRAHLFEPFFTTKEKGKGTGLGLATVYGIVKQAGGEVHVESAPGAGTTFHVLLPRVDDAGEAPAAGPAAVPAPRGSETVLLVEDDPHVRAAAARALRGVGYVILEAGDGEDALARAAEAARIDAVVTDVVMPRLGGAALAARLRATRGPIRILFVSGYAEENHLQRALGDGPSAILWKPFTTATLARALRDLLDGRRDGPARAAAAPAGP